MSEQRISKKIRELTFEYSAIQCIEKIARSSPGCIGEDFNTKFALITIYSNLNDLSKVLPGASQTIYNYLYALYTNTNVANRAMQKSRVSRKDVIKSFCSEYHLSKNWDRFKSVMNKNKISLVDGGENIQDLVIDEYLFLHVMGVYKIIENNDLLYGEHIVNFNETGVKVKGISFKSKYAIEKKIIKTGYALCHFATVIAVIEDKNMLEEIWNTQSISGRYKQLINNLSDKEIDLTNNGSEKSLFNWASSKNTII